MVEITNIKQTMQDSGNQNAITTESFINIIDNNFKNLNDQGIAEQGTKDNWYYQKWNNGVVECWRKMTISVTMTKRLSQSNFYITDPQYAPIPSGLIATDTNGNAKVFAASIEAVRDAEAVYQAKIADISPNNIKFYLYREGAAVNTSTAFVLYFNIKGRWN